jgi:hypothetical protein
VIIGRLFNTVSHDLPRQSLLGSVLVKAREAKKLKMTTLEISVPSVRLSRDLLAAAQKTGIFRIAA